MDYGEINKYLKQGIDKKIRPPEYKLIKSFLHYAKS